MKRTMYQAARHTPKRNAPGSNPGRDATNNAESLDFSRFSAFLMEWRNREIQAERHGAVDALNELLIQFTS